MKRFMIVSAVAVSAFAFAACSDFRESDEFKSFKAFVAKCKADPSTEDCKAWDASKTSPTN